MAGGKKRKSIAQMSKSQKVDKSKGSRKGKKGSTAGKQNKTDIKSLRIVTPNPSEKKVQKQIGAMKVLTPYTVATRFNINLSSAKNLLKKLQQKGIVTYVSGSKNIRIYKPV